MKEFRTIKEQNKKFQTFIEEFRENEKTIWEKLKGIKIDTGAFTQKKVKNPIITTVDDFGKQDTRRASSASRF